MTDAQPDKPAKKATAPAVAREEAPEPLTSPDVALGNVAEEGLVEVRTTMRPDQVLLVSEAEARDLESQGLLTEEETDDAR